MWKVLCSKYRKWGECKYVLLTSWQARCPSLFGFLGILGILTTVTCPFRAGSWRHLLGSYSSGPIGLLPGTLKVLVYTVISMYIHLYLLVCMCAHEYGSKVNFECCSSGTIHLGFLETVCPWPVFLIMIGFPIMQGWPTLGSPIWCPFLKLHSCYCYWLCYQFWELKPRSSCCLHGKHSLHRLSYLLSHLLIYLFICQFKKVFSVCICLSCMCIWLCVQPQVRGQPQVLILSF